MTKHKPSIPPPLLSYHKIGEVVRKYRVEKKLKLIDLAEQTKISPAMLSKIENGRMIPTIPSLFAIIQQLQVPPERFLADLNANEHFEGYLYIPRSSYRSYTKETRAIGFNYLSILEHTIEGGAFQISLLTLEPGAKRKPVSTEAFEYLYVINGPLDYQLPDKTLTLKTGDSLFFDGRLAHLPVNKTKKKVSMLVIFFFINR